MASSCAGAFRLGDGLSLRQIVQVGDKQMSRIENALANPYVTGAAAGLAKGE